MPSETELIAERMRQTRAALTGKLDTLENRVLGTADTIDRTVRDVGASVRGTAEDVRTLVRKRVATALDALDVTRQVERHPWLMLVGAALAGYVAEEMMSNLESQSSKSGETPPRASGSSFLRAFADALAPEVEKLKAAYLSLVLAAARDTIRDSVPEEMHASVTDFMDRFTVNLGLEPHPPRAASSDGKPPG
jgi:BMFP domain-containing protein YqiC